MSIWASIDHKWHGPPSRDEFGPEDDGPQVFLDVAASGMSPLVRIILQAEDDRCYLTHDEVQHLIWLLRVAIGEEPNR